MRTLVLNITRANDGLNHTVGHRFQFLFPHQCIHIVAKLVKLLLRQIVMGFSIFDQIERLDSQKTETLEVWQQIVTAELRRGADEIDDVRDDVRRVRFHLYVSQCLVEVGQEVGLTAFVHEVVAEFQEWETPCRTNSCSQKCSRRSRSRNSG